MKDETSKNDNFLLIRKHVCKYIFESLYTVIRGTQPTYIPKRSSGGAPVMDENLGFATDDGK